MAATRAYDAGMTQAAELIEDAALETVDRCDRCGAQAKSRVRLQNGELLFCGHHFREHAEALANAVKVPRSL